MPFQLIKLIILFKNYLRTLSRICSSDWVITFNGNIIPTFHKFQCSHLHTAFAINYALVCVCVCACKNIF
jgi:hypothetical protein